MKCPKCNNKDIEISIANGEAYVEAEIYCSKCEDIVAFYRIKDNDWLDDI